MKAVAELLAIATLALAGAGATYFIKGPPSRTFVCDPAQLLPDEICFQQITGPVVWIDARSRAEWSQNGVANSVLWNLEAAEDTQKMEATVVETILQTGLGSDGMVVVYCSSEACGTSRQIAQKISNLNIGPQVKVLKGGWDALKK